METLKKFIRYYAPYKTVFFLDLICAAIISIVDLIYPQLLRSLAATLFTRESSVIMRALLPLGIGLFLMYVIQSLCKYYVSYQGHMMGANMERDMRQQLFDHYEKLSFSYYDQNNSGQMMSKLVSDLFDIAECAHHAPENFFISLIKVIGAFVFLFLINWRLAIPMAVLVVVMFLFSFSQNQRMQITFMDNRKKIGDVNASLQDTLAGIRVVQSFANEDVERTKFRKSNQGFLLSKDANYKCMGTFMGSNLFFQGMMYLVTLVFGGFLIAAFSALRLAKFNIDERQHEEFRGLPTPACTLFFVALPMLGWEWIATPALLLGLTVVFSALLVCDMPMFSLKFKSFDFGNNRLRYVFLLLAVIFIVWLRMAAPALIILAYIVISTGRALFFRPAVKG